MSDALCVLLYMPCLMLTVILFVSTLHKKMSVQYALFYALLLGWQLCVLLSHATGSERLARYFFSLKFVLIAYLVVLFFYMLTTYYRLSRPVPVWGMLLLALIPTVTAILAISGRMTTAVLFSGEQGAGWFAVHMIYSQSVIALTSVFIWRRLRGMPRWYRSGVLPMAACLANYFVFALIDTVFAWESPLDITLIGTSLSGFLLYLAIIHRGQSDYMRHDILHTLDEGILILNPDGWIISANSAAQQLIYRLLETSNPLQGNFHRWLETWSQQGKIVRRQLEVQAGENMIVLGGAYPQVYRMRVRPIENQNLGMIGRFVILKDVTNDHLFMERLRETAGVDSLTGLPNRYRYQELLRTMDVEENLPLSIVAGDVNELKKVNDTLGHYEGDLMLKSIAEVLRLCCPMEGDVARIGGDEFVLLLPRHNKEAAEAVTDRVRESLAKLSGADTRPSIAFGIATKTELHQNINTLINEADQRMYGDKRAARQPT